MIGFIQATKLFDARPRHEGRVPRMTSAPPLMTSDDLGEWERWRADIERLRRHSPRDPMPRGLCGRSGDAILMPSSDFDET